MVLGYHRLGDPTSDPFDLCISPEHFAAHLAVLKRRASIFTLREALQALTERRLPPRAVVLTFDDGYCDTVNRVLPLLERSGIPATVFVTPGSPGCAFWWDELAGMLLKKTSLPARLDLEFGGRRKTWSFPVDSVERERRSRRQALQAVAAELRDLSVADRDEHMSRIREWCCQGEAVAGYRSLTLEEIKQLAASPLIEIGAHTMSHPSLTSLPDGAQFREIDESRTSLEAVTGKAVSVFSYPHGSYSASTIAAVRRSGFAAACCSTPDVVSTRSDTFALPRLWVADQDGPRFDTWLRRWLVD